MSNSAFQCCATQLYNIVILIVLSMYLSDEYLVKLVSLSEERRNMNSKVALIDGETMP